MIKVLLTGCSGKMGHNVSAIVSQTEGMEIAGGVDLFSDGSLPYPVFKTFEDVNVSVDVIIDFSNPSVIHSMLEYSVKTNTPVVLCTTGLSPELLDEVKEASNKVAILRSANMSLGINLIMKVLKDISPLLSDAGFDVEIVEKHHNQKLDAPSGTAIALADSVNEACDGKFEYIYDRSQRRQKRDAKELGISAVRGGTIVGDHDIIFAGLDEVITINHRAYSKAVFAKGAVSAAAFLVGKAPGMYDMKDVVL